MTSMSHIEAARAKFRIDAAMGPQRIEAAIARLADTVRCEADAASARAADGDDDGTWQRRADQLEDIVGELENITVEVDSQCRACAGDGTIECDGGGADSRCAGDESCPNCGGETTVECGRCGGTGEADESIVPQAAVAEVTTAVAEAFSRMS